MKTNRLALGLLIVACLAEPVQGAVTMVSGLFIPFTKIVGPQKNVPVDFDGDGTAELNFVGQYTAEATVKMASPDVQVQAVPDPLPNLSSLATRMGINTEVSSTPGTFGQ